FYQDRLYLNSGEGKFTKAKGLPTIANSGGCVLPIDFDQDGDLDLFVGGRHVPGQYPKAPNSFLLENNKGKFTDVTESKAPTLANIGMVTDAVWTDLNGDKTNELIVVGEWMPITVFEWNNEHLVHHSSFIVHHSSGWWNTISATDYDGDGDMDLVVGNLGLNYKFQASVEKPFKVFANDFDKNGTQDVFLAKNYQDRVVPIRGKECSSQQLPNLKYKFPSYQQFAKADINDILGKTDDALQYEVQTFASTLLDNQNGQLVLKPLPAMAQLSTVNTILPIDVNGDTKIDLVLAGNKFESEVETTRADASVGNLLLQTDDNFRDIPPSKSGLFIPENVKAMRTIRIGLQGQTGVLVAVNDGRLRLFVNTTQSSSSKLGL
ncbi:MAG: VCBS repeat-containing protein, partial [Bacteroidota bacterium]